MGSFDYVTGEKEYTKCHDNDKRMFFEKLLKKLKDNEEEQYCMLHCINVFKVQLSIVIKNYQFSDVILWRK